MSPSGFVLDCRTATSTPAPSVASVTSRHSTALTSERRIPAMKSNPAITPSTRPRAAATAADSVPRPERRGCGHVASTAARSSAVKGAACPRPRSAAVRR